MKILKILLILLVPAIGIVGCQKNDLKPNCASHTENTSASKDNSESTNQSVVGGRPEGLQSADEEDKKTTIVGSGDDDRDGGDKPKKGR